MSNLADFVSFRSAKEREAAEAFLRKSEVNKVLWATRPSPSLRSCTDLRLLLLFGVYALLFTGCWTAEALQSARPWYASFSIPFWLAGLGFLLHPWLVRARRRRRLYVLTARRALIIEPWLLRWQADDWKLKPALLRARQVNPDGSGDLLFDTPTSYLPARDGWRGLVDVRLAEEKLSAALGVEPVEPGAGLDALEPEQRARVEKLLFIGERLLWVGQPRPCVEWVGNLGRLRFMLAALGFALLLTWGIVQEDDTPLTICLVFGGFALILYGLSLPAVLRPFWRRWQLARTLYLLTNRRALVVEPGAVHAWPLKAGMVREDLVGRSRVVQADGSGDLVFEEGCASRQYQYYRRGFLHLPDLRQAEQALEAAICVSSAPRP